MKKSICAILTAFILLFTSTTTFASSYDEYLSMIEDLRQEIEDLKEENYHLKEENYIPNVTLISSPNFTVNAGEKTTIKFTLKNTTTFVASKISMRAALTGSSSIPFTVDFKDNVNTIKLLNTYSEKDVELVLDVDPLAESGMYTINLDYIYSNQYEKEFKTSDTLYIKVENSKYSPKLILENFKLSSNEINSNMDFKLSTLLSNIGNGDAQDVKVEIDGLSSDTLSIKNNINSFYFQNLAALDTQNIEFNLYTSSKIKAGSYPITFNISYKNNKDEEFKDSQQFFINVSDSNSDNTKANIQINNLTSSTQTYPINTDFKIGMNLNNIGNKEAKNIKVTTNYSSDGVIVPKSQSIQLIDSINEAESKYIEFTFAATSSAKSQNYPISFVIEYEDGTKDNNDNANTVSYTQYTGVNISNPEKEEDTEEKKSIPKIIISKYSCNPIVVNAGEEFDLNMTFTNTHPTKTVSNIKIFLSVSEKSETGNIFIPVDSSNTFFVDSIGPNQSVEKSVRLFAISDASPKTYDLIVNFDYEDETGTLPAANEYIGISVRQPAKLETSEFTIPSSGTVGQPIYFSFDFYNTGSVTLKNLMIKIKGDFEASPTSSYYGNFESGNYEYFEGNITPLASGKQTGQLIISYDDANGERIEKITEIEMNVEEAYIPSFDDFNNDYNYIDPMPVEDEGFSIQNLIKKPVTWIVTIAVIIVIVVIIIIIKRKKQKGLDIDE